MTGSEFPFLFSFFLHDGNLVVEEVENRTDCKTAVVVVIDETFVGPNNI